MESTKFFLVEDEDGNVVKHEHLEAAEILKHYNELSDIGIGINMSSAFKGASSGLICYDAKYSNWADVPSYCYTQLELIRPRGCPPEPTIRESNEDAVRFIQNAMSRSRREVWLEQMIVPLYAETFRSNDLLVRAKRQEVTAGEVINYYEEMAKRGLLVLCSFDDLSPLPVLLDYPLDCKSWRDAPEICNLAQPSLMPEFDRWRWALCLFVNKKVAAFLSAIQEHNPELLIGSGTGDFPSS